MDSDEGKLFVGGISWETTEERVRDYFKSYGDVVETVIMKDKVTGRPRGFGFVAFADPNVVDRVLLDTHTIDGRTVEAKKALSRGEKQALSRNPSLGGDIRTKKIFVGGLAFNVTEEDFRAYFQEFGSITDVVVMYDHATQRSRGFGFVTFDTEDAVDRVLQKPFHELREKMVEVKRAVPKELSGGNAGRTRRFGHGGVHSDAYGQNYGSAPGTGYAPRADSQYATVPPGGGVYPPYGPAGFIAGTYGLAMNGGYGPAGFTGGASYATSTGYGITPSGTGFAAPAATVYGTSSAGSRSPWRAGATTGYVGGNPAGYAVGAGGGMSGYSGTAWIPCGIAEPTGVGYGSGPVYGSGQSGFAPTASGYGPQSVAPGGTTAYSGSGHTASTYGDQCSRPGSDSHASPASGSAPGTSVAYGVSRRAPAEAQANGHTNFGGGYATAGPTKQAPDGCFRPYPVANEHVA